MKQDGYLVLAHSEKTLKHLQSAIDTQHRFGVPSELLNADDCIRMVPALGRNRLMGGTFCNKDGSISPFRWLDALLKACKREKVDVHYGTRVEKIDRVGAGFQVSIPDGMIAADKVLLCTDWDAPHLLASVGVELPVVSLPKEAIVTAPCTPRVKPILISLEHHISVNQIDRGSIIFVVSRARDGHDISSTSDFIGFAAPKIIDLLPGVADVAMLRTWGGVSSITPDMQPILGETEVQGLYVAVSSFRGLLPSPAVGRILSALIMDNDTNDPVLAKLGPRRFQTGDLVVEPLLNQA